MNFLNWKRNVPNHKLQNPFLSLQNELDKAMHDFYTIFNQPFLPSQEIEKLKMTPSINIVEDDKIFKVEAEMPGVDENDVKVSVNNGALTITAEKKVSKKNDGKDYVRREIAYGHYERRIALPDYVDIDKAKASFKKGMVWVIFPKKAGSTQKNLELKVEKF